MPPLPGWLGYAVAIVTQVGIPTVFACVLLWFVLTGLATTLRHIEDLEDERATILGGMQSRLVEMQAKLVDSLDRQTAEMVRLLDANVQANQAIAAKINQIGARKPPEPH